MGYTFSFGPQHYDGWKDGRPFTFVDCLEQTEGVGFARIYSPTGRLVLADAGSRVARRYHVERSQRARYERRVGRRCLFQFMAKGLR